MKETEASNISRHAWKLVEQAKNVTAQNLATAVAKGDLKVDRSELPKLLLLVNQSIDQGAHQLMKSFETQVKGALTTVEDEAKK